MVAAVVKRVVEEGLKLRKVKALHILGIDEVSRKKGHRYLTLVYDLERGRFLWVGLDRKEETLDEFFRWLVNGKLEPFRPSIWICGPRVQRHAPQATEEVRRLAHQEVIDLKKTRFILLKNPWNLTPKENRRLSHLLKLNLPIVRAYYLKEEF